VFGEFPTHQINAEKSPFLTERMKVWMLPTLAIICARKTVDYVLRFQELGNAETCHLHAEGAPADVYVLKKGSLIVKQTEELSGAAGSHVARQGLSTCASPACYAASRTCHRPATPTRLVRTGVQDNVGMLRAGCGAAA
jgi:hypothetical protein